MFERNEYIGGRSFPIKPWLDDPMRWTREDHDRTGLLQDSNESEHDEDEPVECGASIFVEANKNMVKAARAFNLSLRAHAGEQGAMSVWDGETFVFTEGKGWGWGYWDLAKMFWR